MLIDSSQCADVLDAEICIVGSGVGAGTLAVKLAERNISFTIIEAGDKKKDTGAVQKEHVGKSFGLRTTTSIQLGGTSNLWHGVLSPLDPIDFEQRDYIPHSGWPITREDLDPFYREASTMLGVHDLDFYEVENLSEAIASELPKLKFDREWLANKLFMQPLPAKNFKYDVKKLTEKSESNHCIYNAVALEYQPTENGEAVEYLKFGTSTGGFKKIKAKKFILCAGALESPRVLLNSRRSDGSQLGNRGGNVGRYLMDHPMGNLCQIQFKEATNAPIYSDLKFRPTVKIKSGLELPVEKQRSLGLPNHNFFVRPSFVKGIDDASEQLKLSLLTIKDGNINLKDILYVLTNLNVIRQIVTYKLSLNVTYKYSDLFFVTEQIPNPDSVITLSDQKDQFGYPITRINWNLVEEDIEGMFAWFKLLKENAFLPEDYEFTHSYDDFNWREICTSAVHHVGTARMGTTEDKAVVDKDLKVFGVDNLYVSDGSVFTTAGNVNSSLTISALSCRLAAHLSKSQ